MNLSRTFKAAIVDDEEHARILLREYLKKIPELELIGECEDGYEGVKFITQHQPDIIFLDIQMPRINGFEMLELIDEKLMPKVIFTTAYDEYAIRAFDLNAADYLLKPISEDRFEKAVVRALTELDGMDPGKAYHMHSFMDKVYPWNQYIDRIVVNAGSGIEMIPDHEIYCLLANDDYIIVCAEIKEFLKKKTLKYYEDRLDPRTFLRVHRSCIANVSQLRRIEPYSKDAWIGILKNGRKVSVSKQGYAALRNTFDF